MKAHVHFSLLVFGLVVLLGACKFEVRLAQPDDEDAGSERDAGSSPEADAGSDAGMELPPQPMPVVFKDDFERADGPVEAPWKDTGPNTPTIDHGRLCVGPQETVSLELAPGAYRYLRMDLPDGLGLHWSLQTAGGEELGLDWRSQNQQITATPGEVIGEYSSVRVRSIELLLEPGILRAKVRSNHGPWVSVELSAQLGAELTGMSFTSTYYDPTNHYGSTVCLDNVYAGTEQPTKDPFADSPRVTPGWWNPTSPSEQCLFDHCTDQVVDCLDDDRDCNKMVCSCENAYDNVLLNCLLSDASGTMNQCAIWDGWVDRADPVTQALMACGDAHCVTDTTKTPVSLDNAYGGSEYAPIPSSNIVLAAVRRGRDLAVVEVDLSKGSTKQIGGTIASVFASATTASDVHLYTVGNHEWHNLHLSAPDGKQRLFSARDDAWVEAVFIPPIVSVQFFPDREWIWVESGSTRLEHTHQLLSNLLNVFWRTTDAVSADDEVTLHAPHVDAENYAILHAASGLRVIAPSGGFVRDLTPGVGSQWHTLAVFKDSVVFRHAGNGFVRWMSLKNELVPDALPSTNVVGSYLIGSGEFWASEGDGPRRVATMPSDLINEVPVSSNAERVLYESTDHWVFADSAGNRIGDYAPAPFTGSSDAMITAGRASLGPDCGILLSRRGAVDEELVALDAYHFDGEGKLVVERVDTLALAAKDVRIAVRREGLLAWQHGAQIHAYDCSTLKSYAATSSESIVALGDYPPIPQHYIPAPPAPPMDEP